MSIGLIPHRAPSRVGAAFINNAVDDPFDKWMTLVLSRISALGGSFHPSQCTGSIKKATNFFFDKDSAFSIRGSRANLEPRQLPFGVVHTAAVIEEPSVQLKSSRSAL